MFGVCLHREASGFYYDHIYNILLGEASIIDTIEYQPSRIYNTKLLDIFGTGFTISYIFAIKFGKNVRMSNAPEIYDVCKR